MILIYISSKIQAKKYVFDADVEFSNSKIIIHHRNKNLVEEKDWLWVKALKFMPDDLVIQIDEKPSVILIPRNKMDQEQIKFFENREIL